MKEGQFMSRSSFLAWSMKCIFTGGKRGGWRWTVVSPGRGWEGREGRSRKGLCVLSNIMTNAVSCNDCFGYCFSSNNKKAQFHLWLLLNLLKSISGGTWGFGWERGSVFIWWGSEFPNMSLTRSQSQILNASSGDFPGGPEVKTPHFHYREYRFDPWSGNQDPTCCLVWPE